MLRPYWSQISLTLQVSQYLVGSRDVREEDPVAQPVERHPQRGEALSGGAVNAGDAEVLGEPVLRGEPKALSTQVVDPGGAQRVAHRHVGEQRRRRDHERTQGQEGGEQAGLVEQLVGSLLEELPLVTRAARSVTVRQGERDEQEVLRTQATTDVGQNHAQTSL